MSQARVMHGARAKMNVGSNTVGIFTNVSYGVQYDAQPIYILGAFAPQEIGYTGQEAINISASGWRVVGHGPHDPNGAQVPKLQDLLRHDDITLSLFDRQDSRNPVMVVTGVRPTGYSTTVNSRGLQEITVTFLGLQLSDESGPQNEPGAVTLP